MSRSTIGAAARRRRKRVLKMASGYYGTRHRLFRTATEAVDRAMVYAYRDRKVKKREFRKLWITRINAAARLHGLSYSVFMKKIKEHNIQLDRKSLANIAYHDAAGFGQIIAQLNG